MDYVALGRTGLNVSVMGLGCGGHSRLGLAAGKSEADAIAIVRAALDLGINFIDTAEAYGTETIVGHALSEVDRASVVLSTKIAPRDKNGLSDAADVRERFEAGLSRLGTDYVDILHLHGVSPREYAWCLLELVPLLHDLRAEGKIRFLAISEVFNHDRGHLMLQQAVTDDIWDVMMVGFNILNQSARERVLKTTRAKGIGTLDMFAVRRALSQPEALRELVADLIRMDLVDANQINPDAPLDFLIHKDGAASIPEAAYRFCRHEPGIDVVLSGTGNVEHLKANVNSLLAPTLPDADLARLRKLFERVDNVTGN